MKSAGLFKEFGIGKLVYNGDVERSSDADSTTNLPSVIGLKDNLNKLTESVNTFDQPAKQFIADQTRTDAFKQWSNNAKFIDDETAKEICRWREVV